MLLIGQGGSLQIFLGHTVAVDFKNKASNKHSPLQQENLTRLRAKVNVAGGEGRGEIQAQDQRQATRRLTIPYRIYRTTMIEKHNFYGVYNIYNKRAL